MDTTTTNRRATRIKPSATFSSGTLAVMTSPGTMETATAHISETGDRWALRWEGRPSQPQREIYGTAAEALASVRDLGQTLAGVGVNTVYTVQWSTHTSLGRQIVEALQ